jgi:hypothetical protein
MVSRIHGSRSYQQPRRIAVPAMRITIRLYIFTYRG